MELWQHQSPWLHDEFDRAEEVFPSASYQYVLYGMGARSAVLPGTIEADAELARRARRENAVQTQRMVASLPRHRDLIERIVRHGLQPI
jgi:tryptophan halogenase